MPLLTETMVHGGEGLATAVLRRVVKVELGGPCVCKSIHVSQLSCINVIN